MRIIIPCITLIMLSTIVQSYGQDFVSIYSDQNEIYYIPVDISDGNTLYNLGRISGTSPQEIMSYNKKETTSLRIGETLHIPVDATLILPKREKESAQLPVYYTIKKGDNLFRIAKYCQTLPEQLMILNLKEDQNLRVGERLLIGWIEWPMKRYQVDSHKDIVQLKLMDLEPVISEVTSHYSTIDASHPDISALRHSNATRLIVKQKGIAYWEKVDYESPELIVMHPYARINSKIFLYNPMLNRKVEAKVVSELPREAYPKDISVVISPSVANALGALDKRFLVEITYVE